MLLTFKNPDSLSKPFFLYGITYPFWIKIKPSNLYFFFDGLWKNVKHELSKTIQYFLIMKISQRFFLYLHKSIKQMRDDAS